MTQTIQNGDVMKPYAHFTVGNKLLFSDLKSGTAIINLGSKEYVLVLND
jgi:hypothetical protein